MTQHRTFTRLLAGLLLAAMPLLAQAHTALKTSVPADGATMQVAPVSVQLEFNGPVRLMKFELESEGQTLPVDFKPNSEPVADYTIPSPILRPGTVTVNWSAMGADGHILSDSFSFTVHMAGPDTAP